jgi:DNA-binding transcriptional regulator of glucitol operon
VRRRFTSPRWLALHALVLVLVAVFLALGWWQVRRAGEGNVLSYGYAVEWPVFAAFTIFVWYRVMRDSVQTPPERRSRPRFAVPTLPERPVRPADPADDDPALAAYNEYLKRLNERQES